MQFCSYSTRLWFRLLGNIQQLLWKSIMSRQPQFVMEACKVQRISYTIRIKVLDRDELVFWVNFFGIERLKLTPELLHNLYGQICLATEFPFSQSSWKIDTKINLTRLHIHLQDFYKKLQRILCIIHLSRWRRLTIEVLILISALMNG